MRNVFMTPPEFLGKWGKCLPCGEKFVLFPQHLLASL